MRRTGSITSRRLFAAAVVTTLAAAGTTSAQAQANDRPLEVSAVIGGHFFSSSSALGRSDYLAPNSEIRDTVAVGARLGYGISKYFVLEGEFLGMPTQMLHQTGQVLAYTGRGHLLFRYPLGKTGRWQPFVLAGGGAIGVRPDSGLPLKPETLGAFHVGAGLRVNVSKWVGVRLDGVMVMVPEVQTPSFTQDFQILASAYARFGFTPEKPAEPPKPVDIDNDGVPDNEDKCVGQAGPKENAGCPDVDADSDGVVDRLDKCPAERGLAENAGCPDRDTDGDSVVDRLDQCPSERGPRQNKGCPDTDADSDGVVDRLDKCPAEPETKNGFKDLDGCPDELPVELQKFVGAIQGLKFLPNKAELTKDSLPILDAAAAVLTENASVYVEIQGHTDNVGPADANTTLSQQRADTVKAYLIEKGIKPERLFSQGYGPTKPVGDNNTAAGRAQNRRVEFRLIPQERRSSAAPKDPAAAPAAPAPGSPAPAAPAPASPGQAPPAPPAAPVAPGVSTVPPVPPVPAMPAVPPPPPVPGTPVPPAVPASPSGVLAPVPTAQDAPPPQ